MAGESRRRAGTGEGRHETCPYEGGRGDWIPGSTHWGWIPDCSGMTAKVYVEARAWVGYYRGQGVGQD